MQILNLSYQFDQMSRFRLRWLLLKYDRIDHVLALWMERCSLPCLRFSLALIFIWFGALKFFPGMSPTIEIIERTKIIIFGSYFPTWVIVYSLGLAECLIGLGLLFNFWMRLTLLALFLQMLATSTPILLLPEIVFSKFPLGLTLEGHHIIKNLVFIGAAMALGAKVRKEKSERSTQALQSQM